MTDELVKDVPREKLEFLETMMKRKKGDNPREVMKQMLPLLKEAKAKGLQFTPGEVSAAIAAIQKYSDPAERDKINDLLKRTNYKNPIE